MKPFSFDCLSAASLFCHWECGICGIRDLLLLRLKTFLQLAKCEVCERVAWLPVIRSLAQRCHRKQFSMTMTVEFADIAASEKLELPQAGNSS